MVIYWDIVFLINLVMNFIILWLTSIITKSKVSLIRIGLGSLAGSIYLVALFFPVMHFLNTLSMKFILSLLIIILTFFPARIKDFLKLLGYFYIVSFMIGGAAFGIFYFSDIGVFFYNGIILFKNNSIQWWILILSVIIVCILMKFLRDYIQKNFFKEKTFVPVTIFLNKRLLEVKALIDTGNNLYDPFSNAPVIIVEYEAIKNLLSDELQDIFNKGQDKDLYLITEKLSKSQWSTRFRLIPFTSIGKTNGMLIGLRPDKIRVKTDDQEVEIENTIIGIYRDTLSPDGNYKALLHPDVLNC